MDKLNIVILGEFSYPYGMAGTKHMRYVADALRAHSDTSVRVVVLRQSGKQNVLAGVHAGIPYETVISDSLWARITRMAPVLHKKARQTVRKVFRPDMKNILYIYGPPSFDNLPAIRYARRLGYRVVFYIVEDYDLAVGISKSLRFRIKNGYFRYTTNRIASLADGVTVVSTHLERKFRKLTSGAIPIHYQPISIDLSHYPNRPQRFGDPLTLFYSGSFGMKDGVSVLLEAFDTIATKRKNVRLVLVGKGTREVMKPVLSQIQASPYRDRIECKGYLDDDTYHATLNATDIPCMVRINIGYAHAGFPFKLGEFLATGKPVIASCVSDVECMLENNREAILVEPGDSRGIAMAAERLIANPDEAAVIGERGRKKARVLFDHQMQGRSLLAFLRRL